LPWTGGHVETVAIVELPQAIVHSARSEELTMSQLQGETPLSVINSHAYMANRAKFPLAELSKYAGQWVAFRADGQRILDSCPGLEQLRARLVQNGTDPEGVVFERVPTEFMILSGSDLA
jgi:hypothetical protein